MWDLIVSVPDHCLSFYFILLKLINNNKFRIFAAMTKWFIGARILF